MLIWVARAPYFFDSSASVISSRITSSATFALNSASHRLQTNDCRAVGAWFFFFVILDRLSHQSIHLNNWSEFLRPPLLTHRCPRLIQRVLSFYEILKMIELSCYQLARTAEAV
ncbi:MAG: hypothetical protein ACI92Z_003473 [Paracoccaceae bacterium]